MGKVAHEKNGVGTQPSGGHVCGTCSTIDRYDAGLVDGLLRQCFEGDPPGGHDTLLRDVVATTAHELETLAYAIGGGGDLGNEHIERSLIIIYNRLRAVLDLETYASTPDRCDALLRRVARGREQQKEFVQPDEARRARPDGEASGQAVQS